MAKPLNGLFVRRAAFVLGVGTVGTILLKKDEFEKAATGSVRLGRCVFTVLRVAADYNYNFYWKKWDESSDAYSELLSKVHLRSAERFLKLCIANGGAFIKVGQHIASLDYLFPQEYTNTLKVLHSDAPSCPYDEIIKVFEDELKIKPETVFSEFSTIPLGTASLAQVHKAKLKDGRDVAVKIQLPLVKSHSSVDIETMEMLVNFVIRIFPNFKFKWVAEETRKNLPIELNFINEGLNSEKVASLLSNFTWLNVPKVYWDLSTERVLTMEYCEGGKINDLNYMKEHKISPVEVSWKLGQLYSNMIFTNGFIHCDPHPGNIIVSNDQGKAILTLLDHGLYTTLSDDFRVNYSNLWVSILCGNLEGIKAGADSLNVGEMYGLLACIVSGRSWESIQEGLDRKMKSNESDEIKKNVKLYTSLITTVLDRIPREMLLILKTNDLLRGNESALNTSASYFSYVTMFKACVKAVYDERMRKTTSYASAVQIFVGRQIAQLRILVFQVLCWFRQHGH